MAIGQTKRLTKFIWDKAGFSLIEMIVVIAVFGILAGASLTMMGQIRYANTERVVELIDTELSKQQIQSMSRKEKPYVYIYMCDGAYYLKTLSTEYDAFDGSVFDANGLKLGSSSIKIYKGAADGSEALLTGNDFIKVVYNRAGSFAGDTNVEVIRVEGSSSHSIQLIKETGKHITD